MQPRFLTLEASEALSVWQLGMGREVRDEKLVQIDGLFRDGYTVAGMTSLTPNGVVLVAFNPPPVQTKAD